MAAKEADTVNLAARYNYNKVASKTNTMMESNL